MAQARGFERTRQRLVEALGARRMFEIHAEGERETVNGCPLAVSRALVAVLSMDDHRSDGIALLPLARISRVRRNANDRAFERRVRGLGLLPAELPTVDLGGGRWLEALDPLRRNGTVIEVRRRGRDKVLLGFVASLSPRALTLRPFDEQGRFDDEHAVIPWPRVGAVRFGTDYVDVYARFIASGEAPLHPHELALRANAVDLDVPGGDPAAVRAALARAAGARQYVRLHRAVGESPLGLIPLAVGPDLLLACPMRELRPDGLEVLRLGDISRVESGPSEHSKTYLLRREGRLPDHVPDVDLSSISAVLASAGQLVILEREDGDFFIGRLLRRGQRRSKGLFLTTDDGFLDEPDEIGHDAVSRIELDSDYLRAFARDLTS